MATAPGRSSRHPTAPRSKKYCVHQLHANTTGIPSSNSSRVRHGWDRSGEEGSSTSRAPTATKAVSQTNGRQSPFQPRDETPQAISYPRWSAVGHVYAEIRVKAVPRTVE